MEEAANEEACSAEGEEEEDGDEEQRSATTELGRRRSLRAPGPSPDFRLLEMPMLRGHRQREQLISRTTAEVEEEEEEEEELLLLLLEQEVVEAVDEDEEGEAPTITTIPGTDRFNFSNNKDSSSKRKPKPPATISTFCRRRSLAKSPEMMTKMMMVVMRMAMKTEMSSCPPTSEITT